MSALMRGGMSVRGGLNFWTILLLVPLIGLLALLTGLVSVSGSPMIIAGYVGLFVGAALLFAPRLLFVLTVLFALVFTGLAEFYLKIGTANWIASGLALALGVSALLSVFNNRSSRAHTASKERSILPLIAVYLVVLVLSSLLNQISWLQFVVGMRNYLPFIGVLLAIRYALPESMVSRVPLALVMIGLIQLPFCLHQAIFVAPMRASSLAARSGASEAIVGTFGGDQLGGGYTGEMAVFVLFASCLAVALHPRNKLARLACVLMPLAALACIAMAETKIVFVLMVPLFVIVFWEEISSSPKRFMLFVLGVGFAFGILAVIYTVRFWSDRPGEFIHAFTYSFDPDFMVRATQRGRVGALIHWWQENVLDFQTLNAVFGYGVASTLQSSRVIGMGNAVMQYGYGLDAHAANKLLWDTGAVGTLLFVWILARTGMNAHKLVRGKRVTGDHLAMLKVVRGAMVAFAAMLIYQISILGGAPMQALFWLFVGYVEYWRWHSAEKHS